MEIVKGFKDRTGKEALKREKIREIITKNFKDYGFEPAETPLIEYEKFVKGDNTTDEAISDIFKLKDKGKRKLALRYEFTFQLKRIAKGKKLPYKRYQIGTVFRDEPVKTGRLRQFTQCDADIIGSSEIAADAEILSLIKDVFKDLKIPIMIQVNNRQLLTSVVESLGIRDKKTELKIIREIDKLDKSRDEAYKNLKKILGAENTEKLISYFTESLGFFSNEGFPGASEIEELKKLAKLYNVDLTFVPSLARGLSYYTGNIFEIVSPKSNLTIAAGGRYSVNKTSAVGVSFGLDRITQLAKIDLDKTKCLIISIGEDIASIKLTQDLRKQGINCSIMYGKPTKALEYANSYNLEYVIFVGKKEIQNKLFKLKDMKTGKQKMLSKKDLIKRLK